MSLAEQYHAAHKARLERLGMRPKAKTAQPTSVAEPEINIGSIQKPVWFSVEDSPPPPNLFIQDVIKVVCRYFDITETAIKGERRTANVVYPRQVAAFLARRYTTRSLPEIGRRLGGRDHTTILHGARRIEQRIQKEWLVAYDVAHIEAAL